MTVFPGHSEPNVKVCIFVVNHSRKKSTMPTHCHDNIVLSLRDQASVNSRLFRTILLAFLLALALLAFAATPMLAESPPSPNVLVDDYVSVSKNGSAEIEVLGNDTLPDFASFDFDNPENGRFTSFSSNAIQQTLTFRYSPNMNFVGRDSFMYKVSDSQGDSTYGTVYITVYAELDCSTCLVGHAATPIHITVGADGAFNYHFVGEDGVASGPVYPAVQELSEMHPQGSGNIVLYDGTNSLSGAAVVISYLSTEQVVHVNTSYLDRHDGSMKPYIFVINQDNEVSHWEW